MKVTLELGGIKITFSAPAFAVQIEDEPLDSTEVVNRLEKDAADLDETTNKVKAALDTVVDTHPK